MEWYLVDKYLTLQSMLNSQMIKTAQRLSQKASILKKAKELQTGLWSLNLISPVR